MQNIDFGSVGTLGANVDATGQVSVTCTPATACTVSLNGGTTGSTPTARKMSKGAETVTYGLFKDVARLQPWGDASTPGSTVPGTGDGATQNLTVYGRVPPQATHCGGDDHLLNMPGTMSCEMTQDDPVGASTCRIYGRVCVVDSPAALRS
ncbi:spore coat U domain-containing protein [Mesorhizobium sp. M0207]|uniref:Csu type fimbrial protein n=1 Tax=unclassified Mesorhizobium TaxID=325217 RepID=UPI00333C6DC3